MSREDKKLAWELGDEGLYAKSGLTDNFYRVFPGYVIDADGVILVIEASEGFPIYFYRHDTVREAVDDAQEYDLCDFYAKGGKLDDE